MPQVVVSHFSSSHSVDPEALDSFASLSDPRPAPSAHPLVHVRSILRGVESLSYCVLCTPADQLRSTAPVAASRWAAALALLELPENTVGHLERMDEGVQIGNDAELFEALSILQEGSTSPALQLRLTLSRPSSPNSDSSWVVRPTAHACS